MRTKKQEIVEKLDKIEVAIRETSEPKKFETSRFNKAIAIITILITISGVSFWGLYTHFKPEPYIDLGCSIFSLDFEPLKSGFFLLKDSTVEEDIYIGYNPLFYIYLTNNANSQVIIKNIEIVVTEFKAFNDYKLFSYDGGIGDGERDVQYYCLNIDGNSGSYFSTYFGYEPPENGYIGEYILQNKNMNKYQALRKYETDEIRLFIHHRDNGIYNIEIYVNCETGNQRDRVFVGQYHYAYLSYDYDEVVHISNFSLGADEAYNVLIEELKEWYDFEYPKYEETILGGKYGWAG